ncbi:MAG: MFS transporter [Acidimicrobiales bacterium]
MSSRSTKKRSAEPIDHVAIGLLGLVTIVAYGSWYYAFGVLLDPIRLDTGWSEAALAASFSVGGVTVGFGAIFGGRLLDKLGSRTVLVLGGVGGAVGLLATSMAENVIVFAISATVAMGFLGAFGFYHATMATAVRANPGSPARAIAVLTIWGAFASVLYLPMTAALVNRLEWRATVRVLAVLVIAVFALAAVLVPVNDSGPPPETERSSLRRVLAATVSNRERRAFTAAVALGGIAMSTVLVYQVPTMTEAGLPLTTAATLAGVRGFAQTGGRIPLTPIVNRLGSSGALVLSFAAIAVGGALLAFSGNVVVALGFAVVTGFGIGAFSPLQGIKAEELFERDTLGATMGSYSMVLMVAGSAGPVLAGVIVDLGGDRRVVTIIIVSAALAAMAFALRLRAGGR